jgi:site-specific recombinase XerD
MKRFCAFLADNYRLQKLSHISGKHLVNYILYMQEQGKSASTVKTDLAAIRFFHDKMERAKYRLPDNDELGVELERRSFGGVDRTWSEPEFNRLLAIAAAEEREDYILALYLGRLAGLRIHECFRIDTAIAEKALRENAITIKGKGGKIRTVPIEDERITVMLRKQLTVTRRGHKLLVPDDMRTDVAIAELQQFIAAHRDTILH